VASGEWPFEAQDRRVASKKPPIGGYVLAGGASSRFGADKALALLDGKTMLARMCELVRNVAANVLVVGAQSKYEGEGTEVMEDLWPGEGPLGGIITALMATGESPNRCDWNLIVSCDMPFLTAEWLRYLAERALKSPASVVVPRSREGLEPLCACWRTSATGKLQYAFADGVRKVTEAMKHLEMEILDEAHWKRFDNAGRLFWNMNTPQDYESAQKAMEEERQ